MARFAPKANALRPIVEIVHNSDVKDAKFERPGVPGSKLVLLETVPVQRRIQNGLNEARPCLLSCSNTFQDEVAEGE